MSWYWLGNVQLYDIHTLVYFLIVLTVPACMCLPSYMCYMHTESHTFAMIFQTSNAWSQVRYTQIKHLRVCLVLFPCLFSEKFQKPVGHQSVWLWELEATLRVQLKLCCAEFLFQAELAHGRVCMLATLGFSVQTSGAKFDAGTSWIGTLKNNEMYL